MAGELKQIIDEIETYIREVGGQYGDWFVGIADNPINPIDEASLLHKVERYRFMYIETISPQAAKAAADYFVNKLGTDGNLNDNRTNGACRAVYVYKKAVHHVKPVHSPDWLKAQDFGLVLRP